MNIFCVLVIDMKKTGTKLADSFWYAFPDVLKYQNKVAFCVTVQAKLLIKICGTKNRGQVRGIVFSNITRFQNNEK